MKKSVLIIILVLVITNIATIIYLTNRPSDSASGQITNPPACGCDADRFKSEYEGLNGKDNSYGGTYLSISIPSDNPVEYVDFTRVKQILANGTGVIYFGFPECPWCRNISPTLLDVAMEFDSKIFYLNNKEDRDIRKLDDNGNIIIEKEGSAEYYELLELLTGYTSVYDGLNDESIKRLYFPTVIFVKDGEIVGFHEGTVESHIDASVYLNAEQQKELKAIYRDYFNKMISGRCSINEPGC